MNLKWSCGGERCGQKCNEKVGLKWAALTGEERNIKWWNGMTNYVWEVSLPCTGKPKTPLQKKKKKSIKSLKTEMSWSRFASLSSASAAWSCFSAVSLCVCFPLHLSSLTNPTMEKIKTMPLASIMHVLFRFFVVLCYCYNL